MTLITFNLPIRSPPFYPFATTDFNSTVLWYVRHEKRYKVTPPGRVVSFNRARVTGNAQGSEPSEPGENPKECHCSNPLWNFEARSTTLTTINSAFHSFKHGL